MAAVTLQNAQKLATAKYVFLCPWRVPGFTEDLFQVRINEKSKKNPRPAVISDCGLLAKSFAFKNFPNLLLASVSNLGYQYQ